MLSTTPFVIAAAVWFWLGFILLAVALLKKWTLKRALAGYAIGYGVTALVFFAAYV